jgi:hypothetical protein
LPHGVEAEMELVRGPEDARHLLVELAHVEPGPRQGGEEREGGMRDGISVGQLGRFFQGFRVEDRYPAAGSRW